MEVMVGFRQLYGLIYVNEPLVVEPWISLEQCIVSIFTIASVVIDAVSHKKLPCRRMASGRNRSLPEIRRGEMVRHYRPGCGQIWQLTPKGGQKYSHKGVNYHYFHSNYYIVKSSPLPITSQNDHGTLKYCQIDVNTNSQKKI